MSLFEGPNENTLLELHSQLQGLEFSLARSYLYEDQYSSDLRTAMGYTLPEREGLLLAYGRYLSNQQEFTRRLIEKKVKLLRKIRELSVVTQPPCAKKVTYNSLTEEINVEDYSNAS